MTTYTITYFDDSATDHKHNDTDHLTGELCEAIKEANKHVGNDTITFASITDAEERFIMGVPA